MKPFSSLITSIVTRMRLRQKRVDQTYSSAEDLDIADAISVLTWPALSFANAVQLRWADLSLEDGLVTVQSRPGKFLDREVILPGDLRKRLLARRKRLKPARCDRFVFDSETIRSALPLRPPLARAKSFLLRALFEIFVHPADLRKIGRLMRNRRDAAKNNRDVVLSGKQ